MKRWIYTRLMRFLRANAPKPDYRQEADALREALGEAQARENRYRADYMERACELIEARQMAGTGPWLVAEERGKLDKAGAKLRETDALISQGAYGDIELALQNVEWRRQVNLSWLEF